MLRFFHSPYPTFGSYKNPTPWKIEASPYFWWWYALTLNTGYAQLCTEMADNQNTHSADAQMLKVYEDFGDTRYDGCRYLAFTQWWRNRVNTNEQRGVYLFAEPLNTAAVSVVEDAEQATSAFSCDDTVMIAVNVTRQRKHIDKRIDQILKQHGLVTYLCRPRCSFRPLGVRMPRGFCLPMLSADGAGYRSR